MALIDRSDISGLSLAVAGHVVLFGLLSVGFLATPNPLQLRSTPIEVSITDESALESMSPVPNSEVPAARLSPVEAPIEPEMPPPEPMPPTVQPEAKAKPTPPRPAPAPEAAPARPKERRPSLDIDVRARPTNKERKPTGALDGLELGSTSEKSKSPSTTPPAATIGPEVRSSLAAEIIRQIKPHWKPPTGADTDRLRTTVRVRLAQNGSIVGEPTATQTGRTAQNAAQADLHKERAIRAVKLAAPFNLPEKFYDAWKVIEPTLYEDL